MSHLPRVMISVTSPIAGTTTVQTHRTWAARSPVALLEAMVYAREIRDAARDARDVSGLGDARVVYRGTTLGWLALNQTRTVEDARELIAHIVLPARPS